jgi:peptide chain release factor
MRASPRGAGACRKNPFACRGCFADNAPIMSSAPDDDALNQRMRRLGIRSEDLEESFIRGTGAGGQKINKTSSTVVLFHVPTGLEVRCQRERSQAQNRIIARQDLCDKLEARLRAARQVQRDAVELKKRQNRKRPRGLKERILEHKHRRSEVKRHRSGKVRGDD